MVPILNKPFLEHTIGYLEGYGVDHIILALGYLPDPIQSYFGGGERWGIKLTYAVEESPLGTAGAVKNVAPYLDDTFFVFNGDVFTDFDLGAQLAFHRERRAWATIALTPVEDPTAFGVVETDDRGRVARFVEKPGQDEVTTNMINAGIYILEPQALEQVPPGSYFMFERDLFPLLIREGAPIYGHACQGYWIDMGTPEKYLRLNHDLLLAEIGQNRGEGSPIHPSAHISPPVLMGPDCDLGPGVRISGPAVLGSGCQVGQGSAIHGAVLWPGVRVGAQVTLRNCILAAGSLIGDRCLVEDGCIVGEGAAVAEDNKLGQGTKVWPGKHLEPGAISF
jgi:mannose-1-phosphate guanylyltransferase